MASIPSVPRSVRSAASLSNEERELIRSELRVIVKSQYFKNSRRYPEFLTYLVEKVLQEETNDIKERTIGIEVFGRPLDYDTNTDPIVRNTASEVRKRLALYRAHQDASKSYVSITLQPGDYVPEFYVDALSPEPDELCDADAAPSVLAAGTEDRSVDRGNPSSSSRRQLPMWIMATVTVTVLVTCLGNMSLNQNEQDSTFLDGIPICPTCSSKDVQVVVSASSVKDISAPAGWNEQYPDLVLEDARAAMQISGALSINRLPYQLRLASTSELSDLTDTTDIFVGSTSNRWTMLSLRELRYQFEEQNHILVIKDTQNEKHPACVPNGSSVDPSTNTDCAILARFYSPLTASTVVVVAGSGRSGTEAAGSLIASPNFENRLAKMLPKNWQHKNVEILLKVVAVDGRVNAPTVLSVHMW